MCLSNLTFNTMSNEDVKVSGSICELGVLDSYVPDQQDVQDQGIDDVFKGLDFDCSSELSSLSNEESDSSKVPVKQMRKHLVIGKHIEIVEGEQRKYKCTICNCQFTWKQQIRYHDYCVTGKRPLKCELCDKRFVKQSHFVYHMRTHTGESPFKCSACPKTFKQRDKLKRHEKTHKESGSAEKFRCSVCEKDYCDKDSLKKHELKHDIQKKIKCKHCSKKYVDKFTLKQHMAAHQHPEFICEVCGKRFRRKNSLNIHMQMHEDVYPHQCPECNKTFRTRKELTQHRVVHDKNNSGFECSVCSIMCGRKDNLLRHVRNCHLDPSSKKDQKVKKTAEDIVANDLVKKQTINNRNVDVKAKGLPVVADNPTLVTEFSQSSFELMTVQNRVVTDMLNGGPSNYLNLEKDTSNIMGVQLSSNENSKGKKDKTCQNLRTCNSKKPSSDEIADDEGTVMASSFQADVFDKAIQDCNPENIFFERKSVMVSKAPNQSAVDLLQADASKSTRDQHGELPESGKTSVIVHTSAFQETFCHQANTRREPVIKCLRPSKEIRSIIPDTP